jgi:hypothetical protein
MYVRHEGMIHKSGSWEGTGGKVASHGVGKEMYVCMKCDTAFKTHDKVDETNPMLIYVTFWKGRPDISLATVTNSWLNSMGKGGAGEGNLLSGTV